MRTSDNGTVEIRIHGVGGSPGEAMLGSPPSPSATRSTAGPGTCIWRRNDGTGVEAYDWGALSSSSPVQALWVFLLPFTLVNVAGRLAPVGLARTGKRMASVHALIVRAVGVSLTFSWTAWLGVAFVDLIGCQWFRRVGAIGGVARWLDRTPEESALLLSRIGMLLGIALTASTMFLLWKLSGGRANKLSSSSPTSKADDADTAPELARADFFAAEDSGDLLLVHAGAVACALAVIVRWILAMDDFTVAFDHIDMGGLVLAAFLFQALTVGALFASALVCGEGGIWRRLSTSSGSACALACVLTNAFFAALLFRLSKELRRWPTVEGDSSMRYGWEHTLTDVWLKSFVLSAFLIVLAVVIVWKRAKTSIPEVGKEGPEPWFADKCRRASAKAQRQAAVGHAAPRLISIVGLVTFVYGIAAAANRLTPHGWNPANARLRFGDQAWRDAAAWVLPLGLGVVILYVRQAARSSPTRRAIGTLWDVLTFWPTTHHPLAARCSTAQIVSELREQLRTAAADGATIVVSAHSQGSVLAFAALEGSPDSVVARVRLVTYGSPLETIYSRMFPAYFGEHPNADLIQRLSASGHPMPWRNFYRLTDPIGGPIDPERRLPTSPEAPFGVEFDTLLDDPAMGPLTVSPGNHGVAPFEPPRATWGSVAAHSHYLAEPKVQDWIAGLRRQ
jgi:hypothetical protein